MEDRFGLIVGRMGGDDESRPNRGGRRFEKLVAGRSGGRFQSVAASRAGQVEPHPAHFARHAQPPAELDDQGMVALGLQGRN